LLSGCSKETEGVKENTDFNAIDISQIDLSKNVVLKHSTNNVGSLFGKIGIKGVEVNNKMGPKGSNTSLYKIDSKKGFYLNRKYISIKDYTFAIKDNFLVNVDNIELGASIIDNRIILKNGDKIYFADSKLDRENENDFTILTMMLSEIITPFENKISSKDISSRMTTEFPDCNFMNTYYEMFSGFTRSAAAHRTEIGTRMIDQLIDYSDSSCRLKGVDTYCEWGDFICVTVVTYCCPDGDGFPY